MLLRFLLKPLFELSYLFGQMAYLIGIPTAWFLPRLICGIEGLSQPVLLAAVLVEPKTLSGVVSRERSVNSPAPFAKLVGERSKQMSDDKNVLLAQHVCCFVLPFCRRSGIRLFCSAGSLFCYLFCEVWLFSARQNTERII